MTGTLDRDVARWQAIMTAGGRGEPISRVDEAFRERFEAREPLASDESALWWALGSMGAPISDDHDARIIEQVVDRHRRGQPAESVTPSRSPWLRNAAIGIGACLAMAVMLEVVSRPVAQPAQASPSTPENVEVLTPDPVEMPVPLATAPSQLTLLPNECISFGPGITACGEGSGGTLRVGDPSAFGPTAALERGSVRISRHQRENVSGFELVTPLGTVRSRGSLVATRSETTPIRVVVLVLDGVAFVEHQGGDIETIAAGDHKTLSAKPQRVAAVSRVAPLRLAPDELLRSAQEYLADEDRDNAVRAYQQLIDNHPNSPQANIAMISLGRLALADRAPARALRWFERYLETGASALAEEARYGRVLAFRKLAREHDEQAALRELAQHHPGSPYLSRGDHPDK